MDNRTWIDRALGARKSRRSLALFFGDDGVLAPSPDPTLTQLPARTLAILNSLCQADGITLGVFAERDLDDLKDLIGLSSVNYAASAGMQIDLGGECVRHSGLEDFEVLVEKLVAELSFFIGRFRGAWLDRRPGFFALRGYNLCSFRARCLCEVAEKCIASAGTTAVPKRVHRSPDALEIVVGDARTKRDGLDTMLARLPRDCYPIYACNSTIDALAVETINARCGVTIGIGPDAPSNVQLRVADQERFVGGLYDMAVAVGREQLLHSNAPANDLPEKAVQWRSEFALA